MLRLNCRHFLRVKVFLGNRVGSKLPEFSDHSHFLRTSLPFTTMASTEKPGKVYAISDLHVDYKENLTFVNNFGRNNIYRNDAVIVAGDLTDNLILLESTLKSLKTKFSQVHFVPGNHELWIRPKENVRDSVAKFKKILSLCERLGVHTKPARFDMSPEEHVWIVPLFSWYATPEEDPGDSLHLQHPTAKEDIQKSEAMWMDNHMCKWPVMVGTTRSKYFANMNHEAISRTYDGPVITYSHMLPRKELIRNDDVDKRRVNDDRHQRGLGDAPEWKNPLPGFNFTRYAGANIIDSQLRRVGAKVHVYGHQHRNRDRVIDGVQYISHCLGNTKEQKDGCVWGIKDWGGPRQVWPQREYDVTQDF